MENQELWSKDKMGDAKWVQYLCRLGFSVDFVHRLGAGIDSMGKLLFHVLIGLSYFPNAKERITDCISTSDCICSDQEISPDWVSHLNTHPSDEPSWDHSRGCGKAASGKASGKAGQFSCHTEHAQARRCSSLTGTTFCTQTEISLKYNPDISVWPEWCERQLAALQQSSLITGSFLSEAQWKAWLKDEQLSKHSGHRTKISVRHQGYNNSAVTWALWEAFVSFLKKLLYIQRQQVLSGLKDPRLLMKVPILFKMA